MFVSRSYPLTQILSVFSAKTAVHQQVCQYVLRRYSNGEQKVTPQATSHDEGNGKRSHNRFSISNQGKFLGTALIAIASYYVSSKMERKQNQIQVKMELVSRQLKELYGPLYGNRIVAETSYRSAMKEHGGLKKYLQEAREKKDADMIRAWRSYVLNVLHPLDKEAVDLLCTHAHLIAEKEFPDEFQRLLEHSARMQFVIEQWKNDKGQLESTKEMNEHDFLEHANSTGIGNSMPVIDHLRRRCRRLRRQQQVYMEEVNVDNVAMRIVNKILK